MKSFRRFHAFAFVLSSLLTLLPTSAVSSEVPSLESGLGKWVDRTHSVFFPSEVREKLDVIQSFPLFWWNFLIFENASDQTEKVLVECRRWKASGATPTADGKPLIAKIPCGADLSSFHVSLQAWARDEVFRNPRPSNQTIVDQKANALTQASLPVGRDLLWLFREDPHGSYRELQKMLEERVPIDLPREGGFFVDPVTKRVIVPVQFSFPPSDTKKTRALFEKLEDGSGLTFSVTGPHTATLMNETQVMKDVSRVSIVGIFLTALQILILLYLRRGRALYLFPIVAVATLVAALGTILVFGSIHGLTLAFGTGLSGLAIDYGLHSAFNPAYRGVWKANLCGLITTLAGFFVMMFSKVPLLQQLMVFSVIGLLTGYFLYFFLHRKFTAFFAVRPFAFEPTRGGARLWVVVVFFASALVGVLTLRPNFNLSQFDFIGKKEAEVRNWLYSHLNSRNALFEVDEIKEVSAAEHEVFLEKAHVKKQWAESRGLALENVARYLPPMPIQRANLASWKSASCAAPSARKTKAPDETEAKFFAPYLARTSCEELRSRTDDLAFTGGVPAYLKDFSDEHRFVSIWFPKSDAESASIKSEYREARSIREMVEVFPVMLEREMRWMAPLGILIATFFLGLYYRSWKLTVVALVPFFCALGVYTIAAVLFRFDTSFMTAIALLMVFGFSIDYGVFAVDVVIAPEGRSVHGVWSCLLFSGIATGLGFIPLLACQHPVMLHLGQALVFGTIGTHIGTLWGVPNVLARWRAHA